MASAIAAHRFLERLVAATDGVRAQLVEIATCHGLCDAWFKLLKTIASYGDDGCSQTELAAALGLAESRICYLVDTLHGAGLLHRFRSRQDRRRSVLLLSQTGRERLDQTIAAIDRALQRWLADASDESLEVVTGWLEELADRSRRELTPVVAESPATLQRGEWSEVITDPRLREAG